MGADEDERVHAANLEKVDHVVVMMLVPGLPPNTHIAGSGCSYCLASRVPTGWSARR